MHWDHIRQQTLVKKWGEHWDKHVPKENIQTTQISKENLLGIPDHRKSNLKLQGHLISHRCDGYVWQVLGRTWRNWSPGDCWQSTVPRRGRSSSADLTQTQVEGWDDPAAHTISKTIQSRVSGARCSSGLTPALLATTKMCKRPESPSPVNKLWFTHTTE